MKRATAILIAATLTGLSGKAQPAAPPPAVPVLPQPPAGGSGGGYGSGGGGLNSPQPPGALPPPAAIGGGSGGYGMGYSGRPATFTDRLQSIIKRASGPEEVGPLLIRFSETDPVAQANLADDMAVMAHILEKAVGEAASGGPPRPNRAMGVDLVYTPGGDTKRDLYIEGYGAVFMLRVPFPLIAPAAKPEKMDQDGSPSSEWDRARRELRGEPTEPAGPGSPAEPYREERVKKLTDALLDALRNASNIRDMKAEESVTIYVLGPAEGGPVSVGPVPPRMPMRPLKRAGNTPPEPATVPVQTGSAMTIRVTKANIDSFAKGKSDPEAFRSKAKILAYGTSAG